MIAYSSSNSVKLIQATNPLKLVSCPELHSNSLVYETEWIPAIHGAQTCMIMMDTKGAYPMFVKSRNHYEDVYQNEYCDFIRRYPEQQLVESGRNSMMREVVTVDIDDSYDLHTIWCMLRNINIPVSYCLTQNSLTKHWQIQFHLINPLVIKCLDWEHKQGKLPSIKESSLYKIYVTTTLKLARYFKQYFTGSDSMYKGVMCRNIYHKNQKTYVVLNNKIRRINDCIGQKPITINFHKLYEWVESLDVKISKNAKLKFNEIEIPSDSRHDLTLKMGREYIWSVLREGRTPTETELEVYLLSISNDIARMCNKNPHSEKEILSQVSSIYEWSMKNYHPLVKKCMTGQSEATKRWNFNQHCNKIRKAKFLKRRFLYYKSMGKNLNEISELLKMSVVTLYTYLPLFAVVDLVSTYNRFNGMLQLKSWELITKQIDELILDLYQNMRMNGLDWGDINFNSSIEDENNIVDYNIELQGNREILVA